MEFLFVLAGIAIVIGIGLTKNRNQAINQAWSNVAQRLDLSLRHAAFGTTPKLSGFVSGHDVTVDIQKKYSGKSKSASTRFRLGMPPLGLDLKLKREGFFGGIGKAFGAKDIQIGDAEFDKQILVVGRSEPLMREYLTPERRRTILNFLTSFTGAVITDDEISLSSRGYARNADDVLRTINAMLLVAEMLSEVRDDAEPVALEPLEEPVAEPAPEPEATPTPVDEADFVVAEGLPEQTSVAEDAAVTTEAIAELPAEPASTESAAPADSPALAEFCNAVFAPGTLSFDATQSFKRGFEGKRVRWSGTLESVSPFAVDFDFGSSGGVRAVLTFDANEVKQTGARDIKAVVGLPVGTNGLDSRIGQRVAFAGTLRKVDGFGRKVFVADAELAN
jgi:hypothetical protein